VQRGGLRPGPDLGLGSRLLPKLFPAAAAAAVALSAAAVLIWGLAGGAARSGLRAARRAVGVCRGGIASRLRCGRRSGLAGAACRARRARKRRR
jgi:hypothetical protein